MSPSRAAASDFQLTFPLNSLNGFETAMSTTLIQISAAKTALARATSLEEVLDINDRAAAIQTLLKSQHASLEVQNQAAEIRLRAQRKAGTLLADMEMHDGNPHDTMSPRLNDLGITPKQSSRWQTEAKVPEEAFETFIAEANNAGQEITQAALLKVARGPHVGNNSCDNEWYTPGEYIEPYRELVGNIDVDPASSKEANAIVKAKRFYSIDDDGLKKKWIGNVWMNPPYASGAVEPFASKLLLELEAGNTTSAAILVNNATETRWFQMLLWQCNAACFLASRVKFWKPNVKTMTPLQGQVILYFGSSPEAFRQAYNNLGVTLFNDTVSSES